MATPIESKGDLGNNEPTDAIENPTGGISRPTYLSKSVRFLVLFSLYVSMFLTALDMSVIATAIPSITAEFHSLDQVGWYGSAFFITRAASPNFWGKSLRHFNMKWVFIVAIFVFELGSLICGIAPSSSALIVGRAIQGLGSAGVATGTYTLLVFLVKPAQVPTYMGLLGIMFSTASALGPVIGGALTQHVSWRWCFYINLPIGGVAAALTLFLLRLPPKAVTQQILWKELLLKYDLPGISLLVSALTSLLLALQWGGVSRGWGDATVIATLVVAAVLSFLFVLLEWRLGDGATIMSRIVKQRVIAAGATFSFCLSSAGYAHYYNLPIYFQAVGGVSPTESGVRILPSVLSVSLFTLVSSTAVGRLGWTQPFLALGAMLAIIGGGLIYTLDIATPARLYIGYQVVAGSGFGLAIQVPVIAAQMTSLKSDVSVATSTILLFQFLGTAIGVSTAQNIFNNRLLALIKSTAPNVDRSTVLAVGAYNLQESFGDGDVLNKILRSYVRSLKSAWIYSIALAGLSVLCAFLGPWRNIKNVEE